MSHPQDPNQVEPQAGDDALPPPPSAVDEGEISVEEAEVVEEVTEEPAAAAAPAPPPPEVFELNDDEFTAVESGPIDNPDTALQAALREAGAALGEGGHQKLVELYQREMDALAAEGDKAEKTRAALYQHEVGELYEASGDEGAAVKSYAKALQSDATLKPNLWAIRRVFQRRALWPNLLKLLDAEIRFAAAAQEKAELLVEKGQLLEDRLNDVAQARDCYWKATEANPRTLSAWSSLEKLFAKEGDLAGLAKCLRGMASATEEPARKVALLLDLARLQDNLEGGTLAAALELCREAAAVGFEPARALDELERLAEAAGQPEEIIRSLDARVDNLQARAREAAIADRFAFNDEIVALRRRQASLARAQGEGARAWDFLQSALELKPDEALIVRDLISLGETLGRFGDLAQLYARRAESAPESFRTSLQLDRAQALRRAALAADAEVIENEVLARLPGHLGLLVARERGAMDAGDWAKLAALYVGEAEVARGSGGPTGQADARWAAGARTAAALLHESHLANDVEAIRLLQDALTVEPSYRPSVDALERIYARTGKSAEQAALLEKELVSESQPQRKQRLLEALVALREVKLEDPPGAAEAQRQLVALSPDSVRGRLRLIELQRAAGQWAEAANELRELAQRMPEERRAELHLERAEILERRLEDVDGAAAAYKEVLALRPGDPRAVLAVESISRRRARSSGAHELSPQAWDDLAAALRKEAEASLSPERVTAVLLKLGDVHERERGSFADAAQAYRDLLDKNPGQPAALRGLQRAVERLGDPAQQAEAAEQLAEVVEGGARAEALVALGELYEDKLAKDDSADDAYARALAAGGVAAPHAGFGRLRVAERKKDAAALGAALERLQAFLGEETASAKAALLDERATLDRWAGEADRAQKLAAEAIAADDTALSPQRHLLRARAKDNEGGPAELAKALAQLSARVADQNLKAALERRSALLSLGAGGSPEATREHLQTARQYGGGDASVVVPLADLSTDPEVLGARALLAEGAARVEWMIERAEALEAEGPAARRGRRAGARARARPQAPVGARAAAHGGQAGRRSGRLGARDGGAGRRAGRGRARGGAVQRSGGGARRAGPA